MLLNRLVTAGLRPVSAAAASAALKAQGSTLCALRRPQQLSAAAARASRSLPSCCYFRPLHHSSCMRLGLRCTAHRVGGLGANSSSSGAFRPAVMPRTGLHHRSRVLNSLLGGSSTSCAAKHHSTCSGSCSAGHHNSSGAGHSGHQQRHHKHDHHQHQHDDHTQPRSSTAAHAAAAGGNATPWDSSPQQDVSSSSSSSGGQKDSAGSKHTHSHQHQQGQQEQECCSGGSGSHSHDSHDHHHHHHHHGHAHAHGHGHHHGHSHGHGGHHHHHHHHHGHGHGHHHHHFHTDSASTSSNPVLSALSKTGLFSAAEHLENSVGCTVASITCFVAALLLPYAAAQSLIPAATAALLAKAALSVTYVLSGLPQLAETVYAAVAGKIDTHVLMSLSVLGTLYMGMAQEGALLLLLFRGSHQLEHRLTEKAAGSLQRLFDSVPDRAVVVEVEAGTNAPKVATSQEVPASAVSLGQHVLVRPGEQVPLDGIITWGTANLSLQHISGEAQPVKLGPGQEVPAGSLSTDGLLVVRVIAAAENSTPARIAQLAAEAQATRPQLTRWLDSVGAVWSKAVIGATLLTAVVLPFMGVPFLGDRGAFYRAMGVLTAGSPCALALVPLAYACAIAAITARGILVKSGSAIDALAACKTIALDKTGTITTGSLNLAEGFVITNTASPSSSSSGLTASSVSFGSSSSNTAAEALPGHVRAMEGLAELCKRVVAAGASSSGGAGGTLGTTTGFGAEGSSSGGSSPFDSDDYSGGFEAVVGGGAAGSSSSSSDGSCGSIPSFDAAALKCAVALSRLSNHPVSRAMVDSAPHVDGDVSVLSFEQVPGAGVQGVCRVGDAPPVHVMFGGADWISSHLTDSALTASLNTLLQQHHGRPSRATAVLAMSQLLPPQSARRWPDGDAAAGAAAGEVVDAAVLLDDSTVDHTTSSGSSGHQQIAHQHQQQQQQQQGLTSSSSRPASPFRFAGTHSNRDGSTTFSFEEEEMLHKDPASTAAAASSVAGSQVDGELLSSSTSSSSSSRSSSWSGSSGLTTSSSGGVSASGLFPVDSELALQQQQQQAVLQAYGMPGQPQQLALLCFEDVIQSGVPAAVQQLQSGSWSAVRRAADAAKDVVMLTGDNKGVAEAVACAVGISNYKAGLKPEDKLAYVQQAAAAAAADATRGRGADSRSKGSANDDDVSAQQVAAAAGGAVPRGLLMAGDGINDAPALAAAQVGVAIASTPKDMVAAAADIIVLNGQGITNLPWLFHVADRTHTILKQNLALAVVSVVFATVPTVAGFFPLWLAVTLHEGSTLLVALNSLRLLLESGGASAGAGGGKQAGGGPQAPPPSTTSVSEDQGAQGGAGSRAGGPQLAAAGATQ